MNEEFLLFLKVEGYTVVFLLLAAIATGRWRVALLMFGVATINWAIGFFVMWFLFTYNFMCEVAPSCEEQE